MQYLIQTILEHAQQMLPRNINVNVYVKAATSNYFHHESRHGRCLCSSWMQPRQMILFINGVKGNYFAHHERSHVKWMSQGKLFCSRIQSGWMHECSQTKFFRHKFIQGKLLYIWMLKRKLILFMNVVKEIYSLWIHPSRIALYINGAMSNDRFWELFCS